MFDVDPEAVSKVFAIEAGEVPLDTYVHGGRLKLHAWQHIVIELKK
jgi:hypothetical protein